MVYPEESKLDYVKPKDTLATFYNYGTRIPEFQEFVGGLIKRCKLSLKLDYYLTLLGLEDWIDTRLVHNTEVHANISNDYLVEIDAIFHRINSMEEIYMFNELMRFIVNYLNSLLATSTFQFQDHEAEALDDANNLNLDIQRLICEISPNLKNIA